MPSPLYLGEAQGNRIFVYGSGQTNLGTPYDPLIWTWDLLPAGETGTVYFRGILCSLITVNGATLTVTPYIDNVAEQPQLFQQVGSGDYPVVCSFLARGQRISAQLQVTNFGGGVEICNLRAAFEPIRTYP